MERISTNAGPLTSRTAPQAWIDLAPLAIVAADPQGDCLLWSRWAQHLFGWHRSEVLGRPCPLVPPGGEAAQRRAISQVAGGVSLAESMIPCRARDGTWVQVSLAAAPVRTVSGEVHGILALMVDLTKERAPLPTLTFRQAQNGRLLYVSPSCRTLLGYAPEELLGCPIYEFVHPCERVPMRHLHFAMLAGESSAATSLWRFRCKGGAFRWLEVTLRSAAPAGVEALRQLQTQAWDASERRALEMALRQARAVAAAKEAPEAALARGFHQAFGLLTDCGAHLLGTRDLSPAARRRLRWIQEAAAAQA